MSRLDDNDLLQAKQLPADPLADTRPYVQPSAGDQGGSDAGAPQSGPGELRHRLVPALEGIEDFSQWLEPKQGVLVRLPGFDDSECPVLLNEFMTLSGPTKAGKSRFLMEFATDAVMQGYRIIVVAYEQTRIKWEKIALARFARIDSRLLTRGVEDEQERARALAVIEATAIKQYREGRSEWVRYVEPPPDLSGFVETLNDALQGWRERGDPPTVVLIDAIQNMSVPGHSERRGQIDEAANTFTQISKALDIPIIGTSHENDIGEMKESKHLIYSADVAVRIIREEKCSPITTVPDALGNECVIWPRQIELRKDKDGPDEITRDVWYTPALCLFQGEAVEADNGF